MFHVALFVPTFRVAETLMLCSSYDLEVSLLWLAMEVTGICKRIGKCDMFHVAQFVPAFRVCRNADFVQLL